MTEYHNDFERKFPIQKLWDQTGSYASELRLILRHNPDPIVCLNHLTKRTTEYLNQLEIIHKYIIEVKDILKGGD